MNQIIVYFCRFLIVAAVFTNNTSSTSAHDATPYVSWCCSRVSIVDTCLMFNIWTLYTYSCKDMASTATVLNPLGDVNAELQCSHWMYMGQTAAATCPRMCYGYYFVLFEWVSWLRYASVPQLSCIHTVRVNVDIYFCFAYTK
jgi:hypothetical protein